MSLALLLHPQDDELLRVFIQSRAWARVLTVEEGHPVRAGDVRRVACIGMEMRQMLCSWEQRSGWRWRERSRYAALGDAGDIRLLPGATS